MGNSNKKQARSVSNPDQKVENQPNNEQEQQENQINVIDNTPIQLDSQLSPKMNHQKGFQSRKRLINEKRSSSANIRDKRNSSAASTPKQNKEIIICKEEKNNDKSQFSKTMKVGNGNGEGKLKKSLEDLMLIEIQKLKRYSPPKNNKCNQVQVLQQNKQRIIINQNQNICNNLNQSSLLSNHLHFHYQNNSPTQNGKKSFSPDSSIFERSGLYIPGQFQNISADKEKNINYNDKQQNTNSSNKRIRNGKYDSYYTKTPLSRSQTNPRRRQNQELVIKQIQQKDIQTTSNILSNTQNSSFSKGNQTIGVSASKQIQSGANQQNIVTTHQHSQQLSQSLNLPFLQQSAQKLSQNENFLNRSANKNLSPRRVEELFSIHEGVKKRSMEKEKANYLKQINEILEKKYTSNSKKKLEYEKIEPYVRYPIQNTQTPRYNSTQRKQEMLMPIYIINSPTNEEKDIEIYKKPLITKNIRSSSSEQSQFQNANKNQNRLLRSQLNPINHRPSSNGYREPLKNLSRLRYHKPYQIEFDNQQYSILQNNNVNNFIHMSDDNQQTQQQNTFYTNMKNTQQQNQEIINQIHIIKDSQENMQQENNNNQRQQQDNIQQQQQQNEQLQNQNKVKLQSDNNILSNQKNMNENEKIYSPMSKEKDQFASSVMISTKNNLENEYNQLQDNSFGFQDFNSNHLSNGKMKIRKYQNNSQVGILSNSDIYKIYMKNPLLDVFTSTLKQSQKINLINSGNSHQDIMSQSFTTNPNFQQSNNNAMSQLQESKDFQKQQLIKTYQPRKLKYTKLQQI